MILPDWRDDGKPVRADFEHGSMLGHLKVKDFFFDGEEEVPVWVVVQGKEERSLVEADAWEFASVCPSCDNLVDERLDDGEVCQECKAEREHERQLRRDYHDTR